MAVRELPKPLSMAMLTTVALESDAVLPFSMDSSAILGRGATCTVYAGQYSGESCAVKVVDKAAMNASKMTKIRREISIQRECRHANLVRLVAAFESPQRLYILLEIMPGGELFAQIKKQHHYGETAAADIVRQLLHAITYLHENGICHRDIKPENILLSADCATVKIADFGLAKRFQETALVTPCGTTGYMAPEQVALRDYKETVDIWALGVVLYILLCGFPPFYDRDPAKMIANIKAGKIKFPSPYWDSVSPAAKAFISRCLTVVDAARPTARACLADPWLLQAADAVAVDSGANEAESGQAGHRAFEDAAPAATKAASLPAAQPSVTPAEPAAERRLTLALPADFKAPLALAQLAKRAGVTTVTAAPAPEPSPSGSSSGPSPAQTPTTLTPAAATTAAAGAAAAAAATFDGQPVLTLESAVAVVGTDAIERYLAERTHCAGVTPDERALVDSLVFLAGRIDLAAAALEGSAAGSESDPRLKATLVSLLGAVSAQLRQAESAEFNPLLLGRALSRADFAVVEILNRWRGSKRAGTVIGQTKRIDDYRVRVATELS